MAMSKPAKNCVCPLCDKDGEVTRIYQHLQTTHRKSELSRELLEKTNGESKDLVGAEMQASSSHQDIDPPGGPYVPKP
jgi:hypothetical protein